MSNSDFAVCVLDHLCDHYPDVLIEWANSRDDITVILDD